MLVNFWLIEGPRSYRESIINDKIRGFSWKRQLFFFYY
jgi:hypothetical protein